MLAAREALAAEPGADAEAKADVGRSLTAVAALLEATGKTDEAEAAYRQAEALLADLAACRRPARAALAACRARLGFLLSTRAGRRRLAAYRLARADQEALAAARARTRPGVDLADTPRPIGHCWRRRASRRRRRPSSARRVAIRQELADDNPAVDRFRSRLAASHDRPRHPAVRRRASRRRRRPSTARRWRSGRSWPTTTPPSPNSAADLADSHNNLGILLSETGRPAEAEAEYRTALAIQQKLADDNPAVTEFRSDLAGSHNNLGNLLSADGQAAEAEAEYRAALAIQQKLADDNPAVTDFRSRLANSHDNLGILLSETGKPRRRRPSTARRWRSSRSWPTTTPPSPNSAAAWRQPQQPRRPAVADGPAGGGGGRVPRGAGDPAEAGRRQPRRHRLPQQPGEQPQQPRQPAVADGPAGGGGGRVPPALAICRSWPTTTPPSPNSAATWRISHNNLGILLSETGQPAEAEAAYRAALAIRQKLADDNPAVTEFRSRLAASHNNLGVLLRRRAGRRRRRPSTAALAIQQKLADDNPAVTEFRSGLADSHNNLGILLTRDGQAGGGGGRVPPGAGDPAEAGRRQPRRHRLPQQPGGQPPQPRLLLAQTGKPAEAEAEYRQGAGDPAEAGRRQPQGPRSTATAWPICHTDLSVVLRRLGRPAEARDGCERAIALREALVREVPEGRRRTAATWPGAIAAAAWPAATWATPPAPRPTPGGRSRCGTGCRRGRARSGSRPPAAHAALAGLAGRAGSGVSAAEAASEADAAMALLHKAVAMGYRSRDAFRTEDALDPLRGRDDFRLLMMDLAFPADPFAPAGPARPD